MRILLGCGLVGIILVSFLLLGSCRYLKKEASLDEKKKAVSSYCYGKSSGDLWKFCRCMRSFGKEYESEYLCRFRLFD